MLVGLISECSLVVKPFPTSRGLTDCIVWSEGLSQERELPFGGSLIRTVLRDCSPTTMGVSDLNDGEGLATCSWGASEVFSHSAELESAYGRAT